MATPAHLLSTPTSECSRHPCVLSVNLGTVLDFHPSPGNFSATVILSMMVWSWLNYNFFLSPNWSRIACNKQRQFVGEGVVGGKGCYYHLGMGMTEFLFILSVLLMSKSTTGWIQGCRLSSRNNKVSLCVKTESWPWEHHVLGQLTSWTGACISMFCIVFYTFYCNKKSWGIILILV